MEIIDKIKIKIKNVCIYISNFCREVFENFDLKVLLKYGTGSGTR